VHQGAALDPGHRIYNEIDDGEKEAGDKYGSPDVGAI